MHSHVLTWHIQYSWIHDASPIQSYCHRWTHLDKRVNGRAVDGTVGIRSLFSEVVQCLNWQHGSRHCQRRYQIARVRGRDNDGDQPPTRHQEPRRLFGGHPRWTCRGIKYLVPNQCCSNRLNLPLWKLIKTSWSLIIMLVTFQSLSVSLGG